MEIWKDIKGYEGLYQVSNLGNIKALYKEWFTGLNNNILRTKKEHLLILKNNNKYQQVELYKKSKYKRTSVHRLVAIHFIKNPKDYPCVNHINAIRHDNRIENLEWCTYSQNSRHAVKLGLIKYNYGENHYMSKNKGENHFGSKKIIDTNKNIIYNSVREASESTEYSYKYLSRMLTGERRNKTNLIYYVSK